MYPIEELNSRIRKLENELRILKLTRDCYEEVNKLKNIVKETKQ